LYRAQNLLDVALGIEVRFHNWSPLDVNVPRPHGFRVIEEVDGKPCTEWRGDTSGKLAVYLLRKIGLDFFSMIRKLTSILGERPSHLGIKDANAVTSQLIYTRKKSLDEYQEDNFSLRFLGYTQGKLNHTGNMFEIDLIGANQEELRKRVETIVREGVLPAYIGYQRFGTRRPTTHVVGKMLVKGEWCNAVYFILGFPYIWENENIRRFRAHFMDEGNGSCHIPMQERRVLLELRKSGSCVRALKASLVPLKFFVESYQSYLFNRLLSKKLLEGSVNYGDKLTVTVRRERCDKDCRELFDEEGVETLSVPQLGLNLKDLTREAYMRVRGLSLRENTLVFSLDRGMYATILLSEILGGDARNYT